MNDTTHEPAGEVSPPAERTPSMTASLHIDADQVRVRDLATPAGAIVTDLVSLDLGTRDVGLAVLGTLDHIVAVLDAAVAECRRVTTERKAAGR